MKGLVDAGDIAETGTCHAIRHSCVTHRRRVEQPSLSRCFILSISPQLNRSGDGINQVCTTYQSNDSRGHHCPEGGRFQRGSAKPYCKLDSDQADPMGATVLGVVASLADMGQHRRKISDLSSDTDRSQGSLALASEKLDYQDEI